MYDQILTMKTMEMSYIAHVPLLSQLGNRIALAVGKGVFGCNFDLNTHLYLDKKEVDN